MLEKLKLKLTRALVSALPELKQSFVLDVDVSLVAVLTVLLHPKESGKLQPMQFASRSTTSAEGSYTLRTKEALSVMLDLRSFISYLIFLFQWEFIKSH